MYGQLRIKQREALAVAKPPAPVFPACGKPMTLRRAKSGLSIGKQFWSRTAYPACKAIRKFDAPNPSDP